jgi:hypothetical protein
MNKKDELHDVSTYYMEFLKYGPSWQQIESVCHL